MFSFSNLSYTIGIKNVFPCINISWVHMEVLKTEGAARNPANVNARKSMFDRIKVTKRSILGRYFDSLFWHYFVFIFFLHRRTQMISIDILVPGPSEYTGNSCSIMAENWQELTTWSASLQNVVVVFAIYSNRRQLYIFLLFVGRFDCVVHRFARRPFRVLFRRQTQVRRA